MAEKVTIDDVHLSYTGLFDLAELYSVIEQWLREMGYTKNDQEHRVHVVEDGVVISVVTQPVRRMSDYVDHALKIYFTADKLVEKVVDIDGIKKKLYDGTLNFRIKAIQNTDYEGKWLMNPLTYFFRVVFEKYIYSGYMSDFENVLKEQAADLYREVSAYLNTNKYRYKQVHQETEIGQSQ